MLDEVQGTDDQSKSGFRRHRNRSHARPAKKGDACVTPIAHGTPPHDPAKLSAARTGTVDLWSEEEKKCGGWCEGTGGVGIKRKRYVVA